MLILAVETTGPISSVALNRDGIITLVKNTDSFSHLKELMPMVKELLDEEKVNPKELDAIAVSQGPGSFTGIRIGLVSVKGLAQIWNKPIVEVPTLESFAYGNYDFAQDGEILCPLIDAKMHQVYGGAYKSDTKECLVKSGVYSIEEYLSLLKSAVKDDDKLIFFCDGYNIYKDQIEDSGLMFALAPEEEKWQSADAAAVMGSKLFAEGKLKSCFDAQAEYFRLPEAERKLKERQNSGNQRG